MDPYYNESIKMNRCINKLQSSGSRGMMKSKVNQSKVVESVPTVCLQGTRTTVVGGGDDNRKGS